MYLTQLLTTVTHFSQPSDLKRPANLPTLAPVLNPTQRSVLCLWTMTLFSAAVAAALELDPSSLANGVYADHAIMKLEVDKNGRNAPGIISLLLAKIQLDEPTVVFSDHTAHHINNDDLPTYKAAFDATFAVTTNRNSLHCHLIINSTRTFHQIKVVPGTSCNNIKFGFEKSPGPISKTDLVPMAF
jgi:hypothetical protein